MARRSGWVHFLGDFAVFLTQCMGFFLLYKVWTSSRSRWGPLWSDNEVCISSCPQVSFCYSPLYSFSRLGPSHAYLSPPDIKHIS
ncbi:hypothetical protein EDB19DRAFT_1737535 [Suillus lakei]|nr:hypothetical protein EDB19DRAFT_1737535 [Suillus lakei]